MLILSRKIGERIAIGDGVEIVVLRSAKGRVSLGLTAPQTCRIVRSELCQKESHPVKILRQVTVASGPDIRLLRVLQIGDVIKLWDATADPNRDSLETIVDDSDESISDAIRGNGFEIQLTTERIEE